MKKKAVKLTAAAILSAMLILNVTQTGSAIYEAPATLRVDTARSASTASTTTNNFTSSKKYTHSQLKEVIDKYATTNSDVKGWLLIPNTDMSEPIVHNPNQDNNYYLYRTWDGVNYPYTTYLNYVTTASYLDYRTKLGDTWKSSSRNMTIYGHNWTNLREPFAIGSSQHAMFGQLPSYTSLDFATTNPYIYFSTAEMEGIWKVFAVGYCETKPSFFYNYPSHTKESMQEIVDEWKLRSLHNFDVDVNGEDRFLTLSTCTRLYAAGDQQRFVVVARLLRDGESDTQAVTAVPNPNYKKPAF